MTSAPIQVVDVSKSYQRGGALRPAVEHVSFDVRPGEFCSILGPSGCGKSTLLMMIAGLYPVTSGLIAVGGRPVAGPLGSVGMVFQRDVLLEWRSVLDNVLLPIEVKRLPIRDYRERALELLDLVNLREYATAYPEQLSGGMRQRVSICRALIHEPPLLLMDEPFGALDALTREKINLDLLRLVGARAQSVIFVTHSIEEAVLMSDQIVVMTASPGRVLRTMRIEFEGPRSQKTRAHPRFQEFVTEIREALHSLGII
ncbi:MAG: ABC transporter ATP-binding protein [Polyangiaceae bacterium]